MYNVDDLIVYRNCGVCRIDSIGIPEISGVDKSRHYYTLRPLYAKSSVIYCPLGKTDHVMRPIATSEDVRNLICSIPCIGTFEEENPRALTEKYDGAIKSNDCSEWIKIIKTVYEKKEKVQKKGKKLTQNDIRYMKLAEELLHGELAVILQIAKESVSNYISNEVNELELA